jgi:tryptophan synthase beta chain
VPETLMPALAELESRVAAGARRRRGTSELDVLLRDFAGRPTPLYHAERLSEAVGHPVYLKREDLLHTGAHKINNALGQALLASGWASRASSPRRRGPARRRHRDRVRAARPRVRRLHGHGGHAPPEAQRRAHGLLGAAVGASTPGARTLKEAVSRAIRDWVANVGDTHYVIGSAVGPAPFPASCATSSA